MADNPLEIPQALRDVSEQNLKQAHAAYEQLTAFVTKAMGTWTGALPSNPMAAVFKDVQGARHANRDGKCRVSFHAGRKDRQGTKFPGGFDTSGPFCSRPDAGLRHADAGASKADRGSSPEAATRLILQRRPRAAGNQRGCKSVLPMA